MKLSIRLVVLTCFCGLLAATADKAEPWRPEVRKVWDDAALTNWATPLAGLNARPRHISSEAYYALPVDNLKTYPVYFPDREPNGYWEMLQHVAPEPLIDPEKLKTKADSIEAGRAVLFGSDHIQLRTFDPKLIAIARDPATYKGKKPLADGTASDILWVPTGRFGARHSGLQRLPYAL